MGSSERRERERQELRQKILDAARELFAQRGYDAVTMREIGKRIEYSATALYGHFPDKETLVRDLCRQDFAAFASRFVEIAHVPDAVERLCLTGLGYFEFARRYPEQFRLMFLSQLPPNPPGEGEAEDPTQNAYVILRSLVEELMQKGAFKPGLDDVDLVAQTVWAAVHGAAALELNVNRNEGWLVFRPWEERARAMLELTLNGLMRDPKAALQKLHGVLEAAKKQQKKSQKPRRGKGRG